MNSAIRTLGSNETYQAIAYCVWRQVTEEHKDRTATIAKASEALGLEVDALEYAYDLYCEAP